MNRYASAGPLDGIRAAPWVRAAGWGVCVGIGLAAFAARADDAQAIRARLLASPAWQVAWSPPREQREYLAVVAFRERDGAIVAESAHPGGARCYPEIRVEVRTWGFLFHGCTGVPKEMRYDPRDAATPFKGHAFGFSYRWTPAARPATVQQHAPPDASR